MSGLEETQLLRAGKGQCPRPRPFSRVFAGMLTMSCVTAFAPMSSIDPYRASSTRQIFHHPFGKKRRAWQVNDFMRGSTLEETEQIERMVSGPKTTYVSARKIDRIVDSNTSAPKYESKTFPESGTTNISSERNRSVRSKKRMIKAQKLLEMAQVSPSQRLEMEEEHRGTNSTFNVNSNTRVSTRTTPVAAKFNDTRDVYEMRMAGTFDSVDNLVDSKSLLPGGRWIDNREQVTENTESSLNEMERRNMLAAGQVAEVASS